jgi:hypothetical protein
MFIKGNIRGCTGANDVICIAKRLRKTNVSRALSPPPLLCLGVVVVGEVISFLPHRRGKMASLFNYRRKLEVLILLFLILFAFAAIGA